MTVAALSKLLRHAGVRVKTDFREALLLARLLKLDELVAVRVRTLAEEHARDRVCASDDARIELKMYVHASTPQASATPKLRLSR